MDTSDRLLLNRSPSNLSSLKQQWASSHTLLVGQGLGWLHGVVMSWNFSLSFSQPVIVVWRLREARGVTRTGHGVRSGPWLCLCALPPGPPCRAAGASTQHSSCIPEWMAESEAEAAMSFMASLWKSHCYCHYVLCCSQSMWHWRRKRGRKRRKRTELEFLEVKGGIWVCGWGEAGWGGGGREFRGDYTKLKNKPPRQRIPSDFLNPVLLIMAPASCEVLWV